MEIDASSLSEEEAYKLLVGVIVPRPIAWVSSLTANGLVNVAPFSCYTFVSNAPPMLAISIITLTPVQTIAELVGTFPTIGSDGKLLVYEIVLPGRFAVDAQAVQKKNDVSARSLTGSDCASRWMA